MNSADLIGSTVVQWCSFCAAAPAVGVVEIEEEEWDICQECLDKTGLEK